MGYSKYMKCVFHLKLWQQSGSRPTSSLWQGGSRRSSALPCSPGPPTRSRPVFTIICTFTFTKKYGCHLRNSVTNEKYPVHGGKISLDILQPDPRFQDVALVRPNIRQQLLNLGMKENLKSKESKILGFPTLARVS